MKKLLALVLVLFCIDLSAQQHSRFERDAFELAAQHFNKDGTKLLTWSGPEHTFMIALVEKLHREKGLTPRARETTFKEFRVEIGGYPHSRRNITLLRTLVAGCGATKDKERDIMIYSLKGSGPHPCTHPLAKKLEKLGFTKITIGLSEVEFLVGASLEHRDRVDLRYLRRELEAETEFKDLFKILLYERDHFNMDGDWTDILESSGNAKFADPIKLRYRKGSGDCPSGCTYHDDTIVSVVPRKASSSSKYEFEIVKIEHPKD